MTDTKTRNILLTGGGTGGHVMPIANVIDTIESGNYPPHHIYWYGSSDSLEQRIATQFQQQLSIPVIFRSLVSGKIRRDRSLSSWIRNIWDMIKVV
jgi:UDP-N-acetylglucosamine:LPS N-acetylglucosamine transferase